MIKGLTVTVCLPCRNEGNHLKQVINQIPNYVDEIIVISNKSTDNTVEVAKSIGGKVIVLEDNRSINGIGYGYAHITGIKKAKSDIIIGTDGDSTYPIKDINKIINYLLENNLDFISCNRYPVKDGTDIPLKLKIGVKLLNYEILILYGIRIKDALSGMWVFKKQIKNNLNLTMGDWNLSPQIKINARLNNKIRFSEYSISQHQRLGNTKQNYFKTGLSHAIWIFKNRFKTNQLLQKPNPLKPISSILNWKWLMYLILITASLFKLFLTSGQHLFIIGYAAQDDRLFINLANNIMHGNWLGNYSSVTLIKGPFYPIYLSLMNFTHIPLLTSEQILYIIACIVFLISIYPLLYSFNKVRNSNKLKYIIVTVLGLLLIFNPISSDVEPATRIVRNGIYPSLTLLTISLFIMLFSYRNSKIWKNITISLLAGLILSCFWLTREDGIWLLPITIGIIGYTALIIFLEKQKIYYWKLKLVLIILPFMVMWLSIFTVSAINYHYYGVRAVVEVQSPQFLAAYSSLTRVESGTWMPVIPVSTASRNAIYKVSPAFQKLKPYLDGSVGAAWTNVSTSVYPQYPGQIAGGWFMWAFRYSVESAGYYKNGQTAMGYYSALANQVNKACAEGKLKCTYSTDNMYPPLNKKYIKPFITAMGQSFTFFTGFQQYNPLPPNNAGTNNALNLFSKITNEPIKNHNNISKINMLIFVGKIYQQIFPILTYLSVLFYIILFFTKQIYKSPLFILTGFIGVAIVIRIALLSLVTVTSFPGINTLYFACAYPLLIIFDISTLFIFYENYIEIIKKSYKI